MKLVKTKVFIRQYGTAKMPTLRAREELIKAQMKQVKSMVIIYIINLFKFDKL